METVLLVMVAPLELELRMPVTCCPVADVDELLALRLLALVVLPIVLLEIVFVPPLT